MLNKEKTYHFIGIKGSGMSALALILHDSGYKVQGSDKAQYFFTQQGLEAKQIPMFEFDPDNIQPGLIIIKGNAFGDDHPEMQKAKALGLETYAYHEFLGGLLANYTSIAVTGSHGKTSTTGLLSHTLKHLAPLNYLIGDGTGHGQDDASFFALEACEYRRHFMAYQPDYAIITNVDFDHPDYYQSIDDVFSAFSAFAQQVKKGLVAWGQDPYLQQLKVDVPVHYYGLSSDNEFSARNIERTTEGASFDVYREGALLGRFSVPTYGEHNILNALAVITVLVLEGFDPQAIARHLMTFQGVKRRFSVKQIKDLTIIDDYAHHPSEIRATIDAAKQKFPNKQVVAVFQPHTFSRTVALLEEFGQALNLADHVHLVDIFNSARESQGQVTIQDLADKIAGPVDIVSKENLSPLLGYKDAILLFMGAGDIDQLARQFESVYGQVAANKF